MGNVAQRVVVVNGDFQDLVAAWGKEDALEGIDMRGSVYCNTEQSLAAYNEGYRRGMYIRNALSGGELMGELELMNAVLDSMRQGVTPAECALADQWLYA
jgi:hypothetical protein